jgi:hypothetical protein
MDHAMSDTKDAFLAFIEKHPYAFNRMKRITRALFDRWQDERGLERWQDYKNALHANAQALGLVFWDATETPFGVTFCDPEVTLIFTITCASDGCTYDCRSIK